MAFVKGDTIYYRERKYQDEDGTYVGVPGVVLGVLLDENGDATLYAISLQQSPTDIPRPLNYTYTPYEDELTAR